MPLYEQGDRPPQQRRSRESLERVLKAGERLLAQKGYEGFTIAEVSAKAKVSVGAVYGRFENKDALIHAIHARMMGRLKAAEEEVLDEGLEGDLQVVVTRAVHGLADGMKAERKLLRVFMLRGAVDSKIRGPGSKASQAVGQAFETAVLARRDEIGHPHPERAADVAYRMAYDVLARQVMYGPTFESSMKIDWDELVDELILAALLYLHHGKG